MTDSEGPVSGTHIAEVSTRASHALALLVNAVEDVDAVEEYAIFLLDTDGGVLSWNAGAQQIKGYVADEILGHHISVFYDADDVAAGKPDRELATAINEGQCSNEGWRVRKDGTRFWANVVTTALRDKDGELTGFAKVSRDETGRKAADELIRSLELLTDPERIAVGMSGEVLHRVFEAGLLIEGVLPLVSDPKARERLLDAIELHDQTINELRALVLGGS